MSQNPYEAPHFDAAISSLTYYQPLSTKLTLREYRRISKSWFELLIGVCLKFLRIRIPMSFAFANTHHFQRITPKDISERAREKIKPLAEQALALKLKYAFSYQLPTVGTIEGAAAAFFSDDGRYVLLIAYARTWTQVVVDEKVAFAFVTPLANGTAVATAGSKGDLDTPPNILGEALPNRPMPEVLERHLTRLRESASSVNTVHTAEQVELMLRDYERQNFDYNIERGVYVPVSEGELARLQRLAVNTPETVKPKVKQPFQGIETICWIALAVTLFLFARGGPPNGAQALFRLGILLAAGAGIAIIWIIRGANWIQRQSNDEPPA